MKKNNKKAFSLPEVTIALLILAMAVLPIIGTISNDSKNAVVIANSEFAMQKARYILDTMLDSVDFDDLGSGDPAKLTGESKKKYYSSMFPQPVGDGICQGYITDDKGQKFLVYLKAYDIDKMEFSVFKTPSIEFSYTKYDAQGNEFKGGWELSEQTENKSVPEPSFWPMSLDFYQTSAFTNPPQRTFESKNFYDGKYKSLMKTLILNIKWNDKYKKNPEQKGYRELNLITNKARLKK